LTLLKIQTLCCNAASAKYREKLVRYQRKR
jgi:hypothetical protein